MLLIILISCKEKDYTPGLELMFNEQTEKIISVIRYMAKPPEGVTSTEKFDPKYSSYYFDMASRHRLDLYWADPEGVQYFLISRPAHSFYEKRVGIGGKMKFDAHGNLIEYEEIFRTWKMSEDDLSRKALLLFNMMIRGGDLTPYYRLNSTEEYIEFPDDRTYYDKNERTWKVKY